MKANMIDQPKKTKGTPDPVDKHVGQRLRVRRSLLGMSQEKLADAIGLTFQQIQKYERGANRISAGRLFQFSKILDVPISFFYDHASEEYGQSASPATIGMSDNDQETFGGEEKSDGNNLLQRKETLDLIRAYYSIEDEEARKDIYKFVKSMARKLSDS